MSAIIGLRSGTRTARTLVRLRRLTEVITFLSFRSNRNRKLLMVAANSDRGRPRLSLVRVHTSTEGVRVGCPEEASSVEIRGLSEWRISTRQSAISTAQDRHRSSLETICMASRANPDLRGIVAGEGTGSR